MWMLKILLSPLFFFMQWLAEENILFTKCTEGTAKIVVRSDSFDHAIMSFAGYHLNDPRKKGSKKDIYRKDTAVDGKKVPLADWEVLYHGVENPLKFAQSDDTYYDERPWMLKHLGLYWIGWPWSHRVYVYQFEWNETVTTESGEEKIFPLAEPSDFIFVKDFVYAIQTTGAETNDRLPIDILMATTIAVRNPYRALFSGEDWLQRVTTEVNRYVRNFVGSRDYQELISPLKPDEVADKNDRNQKILDYWKEFSDPVIDLNQQLPDDRPGKTPYGLMGRYGVEIRGAALQTIDLSGDGKKITQEAATREYVARQKAKETKLTADAEGYAIRIKGEQEALALTSRLAVIKANGNEGMLLAAYDAIRESSDGTGNTIIWANNPFGPLTDMLTPKTRKE